MNLIEKLRHMGRQYSAGQAARGGGQQKHYLEDAADEIEALRKDAERYRWLRTRDIETIVRGGVFAGKTPENVALNGEDLDAAIDAAMLLPNAGIQRASPASGEAPLE